MERHIPPLSLDCLLHDTLAECKSGYGLVTEQEIKMLRVIQRAKKLVPMDIVMTLLAAHSVPEGYTSEEATEMIVREMVPAVLDLKRRGELDVELIDISPRFSPFLLNETPSARRGFTTWPKRSELWPREKRAV